MSVKRGPKMSEPLPETVKRFVYQNTQPFVTTGDVAEEFDSVSRRTINERLNKLHEQNEIGKRDIEPNAVIWYPIE